MKSNSVLPIETLEASEVDSDKLREQDLGTCAVNVLDSSPMTSDNAMDEKQLIRRIDFTIVPWLCFLYLLCFLDRVGIGNARLYGLERDLNISDTQYLICLSMFFVPFCLLEAPANVCMRFFSPSVWLSSIIFCWGIVTIAQGLVTNFAGLLAVRILLGVFEAGFTPGATYYLSCWYKRNELGFRIAIFASSMTTAGAFGGLLAAAISNMDGVGDKPAWAWIFILEGIVTVIAGVASFFLVQDYPASARFLSEDERKYVIRRLRTDDQLPAGGEKIQCQNIRKSFKDWKTWLTAISSLAAPLYAFSFFLPTIVSMLGFRATRANLLTVPVYVVSSIFSCIIGYSADRLKRRGYFAIGLGVLTCIGFSILVASRSEALSYFAIYIAAMGVYPAAPNSLAWISNNVEGAYKRSVSMALVLMITNFMGIVNTNTYRSEDAPWYTPGHSVVLGFAIVALFAAILLHILLRRENERRDRGERDEIVSSSKGGDLKNGCYGSVEEAKRDKGDEWSGFRYIF